MSNMRRKTQKRKQSKGRGGPWGTADGQVGEGFRESGAPSVSVFPCVGFPDRLGVKLEYVDTINLAGGVPTPNAQVFLANSLYDPDSTGVGHQPLNYDQLTAIYLKYLVHRLDYEIELYNVATIGTKYAVALSETDISGRTVDQLSETKFAVSGIVGRADGGDCLSHITGSLPISALMGQKELDPDTSMYANYNASPSDGAFLILKVASVDGSSNANCYAKIRLTYHAWLKDRNEPSQS